MAHTLFTDRSGGVSTAPFDSFNLAAHVGDNPESVENNRRILAERIGLPVNSIYFMNQVHGRDVAIIGSDSNYLTSPSVDALFTTKPGTALVTLIADCTPLLLTSNRAIAAVHVGRKGLVAGVFQAAVAIFNEHGISNHEIEAEIGPSICKSCYQVDLDSYREVVAKIPEAGSSESLRCVDVSGGLQHLLKEFGIGFTLSQECVAHDEGFFSYRRDVTTGRQAGVVWL